MSVVGSGVGASGCGGTDNLATCTIALLLVFGTTRIIVQYPAFSCEMSPVFMLGLKRWRLAGLRKTSWHSPG